MCDVTWLRYSAMMAVIFAGMAVAPYASADSGSKICSVETGNCVVRASEKLSGKVTRNPTSAANPPGYRQTPPPRLQNPKNHESDPDSALSAARRLEVEIKQAAAAYRGALARQRMCLETNVPITRVGNSSAFCPAPARPNTGLDTVVATLTPQRGQPVTNGPPRVTVTPREVAYLAVARLQLPRVVPGIGPSPKLNEWDMAVVGYPLWLWADGPTHVGPVSQAVANLSVSLDARITKMVFRMGDGATVTCRGTGTKWSWRVGPAKRSPGCGHTYTKPSLPKGDYTVTAITYWAVRWSINGSSGVITLPMTSSTQLPVGELQVLVTR
jgi:hypothetical protein